LQTINIRFSWQHRDNGCEPVCKSDLRNLDGVSLLDCVLMDDGGLSNSETIPWLNEGIQRIEAVATGRMDSYDWDRETWGVEFRDKAAKIYSLRDEGYFQILSLSAFLKVLRAWAGFLQAHPNDGDAGALINLSIER